MTLHEPFETDRVQGHLHRPAGKPTAGLVITHGAGSNCDAPLLRAVAGALAASGLLTLRCNLHYRRKRVTGPPRPAEAALDRDSLRKAVEAMRKLTPGKIFLGGHSYGGRQASMLAAEDPSAADALLLLSYPLHPPRKPDQLRTAHWPQLRTPAFFVHGTRDPFGSIAEMQQALTLLAGRHILVELARAGHDLRAGRDVSFCAAFLEFAG
jgi:predicted alpha/beta-hydrolase family hydrolase